MSNPFVFLLQISTQPLWLAYGSRKFTPNGVKQLKQNNFPLAASWNAEAAKQHLYLYARLFGFDVPGNIANAYNAEDKSAIQKLFQETALAQGGIRALFQNQQAGLQANARFLQVWGPKQGNIPQTINLATGRQVNKANYAQSSIEGKSNSQSSSFKPNSQVSQVPSFNSSTMSFNMGIGNNVKDILKGWKAKFNDSRNSVLTPGLKSAGSYAQTSVIPTTAKPGLVKVLNAINSTTIDRNPPKSVTVATQLKKAQTDPNSLLWAMIPNAKFDATSKTWKKYSFSGRQLSNRQIVGNKEKAIQLLRQTVGPSTSAGLVYPLLATAQAHMTDLGLAGFGRIGKKGLPSYLGRYWDQKAKRIRTIGKPSYLYNTTDYKQVFTWHIMNMTYKWNQFVRATDGLAKHIGQKKNWQSIVAKKTANNTIGVRRKNQLKNVLEKLVTGTFRPSTAMTTQQINNLYGFIKSWTYQPAAQLIQNAAKRFLQQNPNLSGFQKSIWQNYSNFRALPLKAIIKNEAIWGLQGAQYFPKSYNSQIWNKAKTDNRLTSQDLQAYQSKRKVGKRGPRTKQVTVSRQSILKAAQQLQTSGKNYVKATRMKNPQVQIDQMVMDDQQVDEQSSAFNIPSQAQRSIKNIAFSLGDKLQPRTQSQGSLQQLLTNIAKGGQPLNTSAGQTGMLGNIANKQQIMV